MNRAILFDSPFLLGFEHTRALIERAAKAASESYPPYNVEDAGEGRVRITLAVAGFPPEQLHVVVEDNQLTVAGRRDGEAQGADDRAFLHRGIAARGVLADVRSGRWDGGRGRRAGARFAARRSCSAGAGPTHQAGSNTDGWLNRAVAQTLRNQEGGGHDDA